MNDLPAWERPRRVDVWWWMDLNWAELREWLTSVEVARYHNIGRDSNV